MFSLNAINDGLKYADERSRKKPDWSGGGLKASEELQAVQVASAFDPKQPLPEIETTPGGGPSTDVARTPQSQGQQRW